MYNNDRKNGRSARSVTSLNTDDDDDDGTTNTEPMSNTVRAREKKQQEKRRFLSFTKVLMKFLEKKNPAVCKNARNVILKYKSNKKRGRQHQQFGDEDASEVSICDSITVPLKQIVGSKYWKQAKNQMEADENQENAQSSNADHDFEPISLSSNTFSCDTQVEAPSTFASYNSTSRRPCKRSCPSHENHQIMEQERKLRKQRFWMVVRVLMRYIEKKDYVLYQKARATLQECEKRNLAKQEGFCNLVECVQRELKRTVGVRYWKRAQHHVAKHLLQKASEKAYEDALVNEAASFGSLDDFTPLPLHQEQPPVDPFTPLQATFEPPPAAPQSHKDDWRDPAIPTNVTIPATLPSPASSFSHYNHRHGKQYHEEAHPSYSWDAHSIGPPEASRKRQRIWHRPYPHFFNTR